MEGKLVYDLDEFNRRLSALMKRRRKDLKMTQKALSEKTKIDLKYLQKIESAKIVIEPRLKTLDTIAKHLGMSFRDMMLHLFCEDEKDKKD